MADRPRSPSISDISGGSYFKCAVACSPMIFTIPDPARRALCRFASPFANPGPRCSSVDAGWPLIRYQPSSARRESFKKHKHAHDQIFESSRKCISDVPGFAKHIPTPSATRVATRLSDPFIRMAAHPIPAIGRTRGDPFKKHKHATQARIFESCQEMHLRRAGIGKTYPDAVSNQSSDQTF